MNGQNRKDIHPGTMVDIVLKADRKTNQWSCKRYINKIKLSSTRD